MTTTGCWKEGWADPADAHRRAQQANKRKRARYDPHPPSRPYRCPECGLWHLTSQKGSRR